MEIDFIWRIFNISLGTSVIIGLLLLLTPLLHKRYPSGWRYYVWLIIAARLLIPINIALPKTVVNIPVEIAMPLSGSPEIAQDEERIVADFTDEIPEIMLNDKELSAFISQAERVMPNEQSGIFQEPERAAKFSLPKLLGSIWMSGMIVLFLSQVLVYIKFLRKLYYSPRCETPTGIQDMVRKIGKEFKIARLPEIRVCGAAPSPILTGLLKPLLLLPHDKYSEHELLLILRHELVHFKRRDLLYKLVLAFAKSVHWFNPFVWLMASQADRDVELSCDDLIIAGLNEDDRILYGNAIINTLPIKSKWRLEPVFSTSFGSTKKNMKHRLKNLFDRSLKKKGIVAFCAVILLTGFISGIMVVTPAIAVGSETTNTLPLNTAFSNNDDGNSRVVLGSYTLKKLETCTITISWNEGGTQTLQFIKETPEGKERAVHTEHQITSHVPITVTAWEDGNYWFVIPGGKSMTDIVCVVDYAGTGESDKPTVGMEYISFDEVEIRTYDDGSPYIHDILSNHTDRNIAVFERGMLAFDKNGQPLKVQWFASDDSASPTYSFLYDWGREDIPAGTTSDVFGGWSLFSGNPYDPDPAPEIVWEIEYVLYNLKQITFDDGTVWINPNYEEWLKTYEGKQSDVETLKSYYPYTMEIHSSNFKAEELDQVNPNGNQVTEVIEIPFSVASVEPNKVVCIGKIEFVSGITYNISGSVSAENGSGAIVALNKSPDITQYSGVGWTMHFGEYLNWNNFKSDKTEVYYVYVGSTDKKLTGITGKLDVEAKSPINLQTFNKLATTESIPESNSYLYEGGVAANNYQYGNPFPAKKGDMVKISLTDELSGWQLDKDKIVIKVVIGGNDGTTQEVILSNKEKEQTITISENANHHITVHNANNQLVNYSILLTVKSVDSTDKIYGNEPLRKYYDNDSEIAKAHKNAYFDSCMGMGNEFSFTSFTGCLSIYELDMEAAADLTIKFQSNITQGKFKLVLVTVGGNVIKVSEMVTPDSVSTENTFSLLKGKHTLKIVGLDANGTYALELSGEALDYGKVKSIGL